MAEDYKPGDIELKHITLQNYRGAKVDLQKVMEEFTIFHDMMDNGLYLDILIVDANGLVEFTPIVGDEVIVMQFRTPTFKDMRTYVFRIFSVEDKVKTNDRGDNYVIRAVSQEVINDHRNSVNKSYTNLSGSSVIKSIYNEFVKPNEDDHITVKKKKLFVQDTVDTHHFLFPGVKPIEAINTVCREARVKNNGMLTEYNFKNKKINEEVYIDNSDASNFVFYESYDGWYLKTIDSMLVQDVFEDFYLTDARREQKNEGKETIKPFQKISTVQYLNQFDTIDNLEEGMYYHKVETIDPIKKQFTTDVFTYNNDKKSIAHLEKNKNIFTKKSIFANDGDTSVSHYMQSNIGDYRKFDLLNTARKTDPQVRNPRRLHEYFKYDLASRNQLNNIVLEIAIPGNTEIELGQVVNLHIPQNSAVEEYKKKDNILYGNKFFITNFRHTYNKQDNSFFTMFEAVKDTYAKDVVEETTDPAFYDEDIDL